MTAITRDTLKSYLIRDKQFLRQLYNGPNFLKNKRIFNSASENEINTLLYYIHFLTNGEIIINKDNFKKVQQLKKLKLLRNTFEEEKIFLRFFNTNREKKINFLLKLSSVLPYLLYGLFNLEQKLIS